MNTSEEAIATSRNLDERGRQVDQVVIEIDYAIIEHFSEHLYGSPNKAVEELVSNGFDASALSVYVYLPGRFTNDCILVWDDGMSMDVDGLKKLWWIARSPKKGNSRVAKMESGADRPMIGKFGIGKLASYAVGHRMTHLCRQNNRFLRVAIDYRDVPHIDNVGDAELSENEDARDNDAEPTEEQEEHVKYQTDILELTEDEAHEYVEELFLNGVAPEGMKELWARPHWTLAIITDLKESVSRLTEGRLKWVIGNGMPLRPDFHVWVNDDPVEPKIARGAMQSWDLSDKRVLERLASDWNTARDRGRVDGDWTFIPAGAHDENKAMIRFPCLGDVQAEVYVFDHSLRNERTADEPRSYGFFVMVRGRLINAENELLGLSDPSFGTFYRSQYVIHADGLDPDLLADRERLHLDSPRIRELGILRDALYRVSRQVLEQHDERVAQERLSGSLLPIESRSHFLEPLTALLLRHSETATKPLDLERAAKVDRKPLGEANPIATVDYEEGGFKVNEAHPLFSAVHDKLGSGAKAREALRTLDIFAVSEPLFEGFLYDLGLDEGQIDRIMGWRDGLLRSIALRYTSMPDNEVFQEVKDTSWKGKEAFEEALTKLFGLMGFEARRDGASGKKDVLVIAPIGDKHYGFTVEAKGSIHAVANDAAEISGAAAHRQEIKAAHALVVAREFAGFDRDSNAWPQVLNECQAVGQVSIATVETLIELCEAVLTYQYPLETIKEILEPVEPPAVKLARVQELKRPIDSFDYRGVLEVIWQLQQEEASGDAVPYRTVWHRGPDRWGLGESKDFEQRLIALETLSDHLLRVSNEDKTVTLRQHPDNVVARIKQALDVQQVIE